MIYLDNAACVWPKPQVIQMQIARMLSADHWHDWERASRFAGEMIAALLNAPCSARVRFTKSARDALAWILSALLHPGQHVITSSVEHEAVMWPLHALQEKGVKVTVVKCMPDGSIEPEDLFQAVEPCTRAIVLVHASNVSGTVQPLAEIIPEAKRRNLLTIVDAAQTVGVYPIDMTALGVDVLVFTGHKGLLGPSGTGGFVTGSPEVLEEIERTAKPEVVLCNPRALLALTEGVRYVLDCGVSVIRQHEIELTTRLLNGLRQIPGVSTYGPVDSEKRVGIVCFNVCGMHPNEVSRLLESDYDIVCRAGLEHSPDSHRTLGTWPEGAVRFSVGWSNTADEIDYALMAVESIAARALPRQQNRDSSRKRGVLQRRGVPRRVLVIPQAIDISLEDTEWYALTNFADVTLFEINEESYLLDGNVWGADLNQCLQMARSYAGLFDLVVGECTGAFLWHSVFRLAGDRTPFALIPHFNHVAIPHTFAVLLSSQLALPNDILFAGSNVAGRAFSQYGFHCEPFYPLGVDLTRFRPLETNKKVIRASLGLPDDINFLLYIGRVEPDKNVLELLDVFKLVTEKHRAMLIVCYHYFNDSYLDECRRRIPRTGRVLFVQSPNREALVRYYNAADLFVSTAVSEFETFGRSPVEAMACGLPPIVPEYDGFRETIPPDCGVLIPTISRGYQKRPDVSAFAKAISSLLSDQEALKEKAQHSIQHAQQFAREKTLQRMLDRFGYISSDHLLYPLPVKISLDSYPLILRALWSALEGRSIASLMADFLQSGDPPIQPTSADLQRFQEAWFADY